MTCVGPFIVHELVAQLCSARASQNQSGLIVHFETYREMLQQIVGCKVCYESDIAHEMKLNIRLCNRCCHWTSHVCTI
jgi:hypothetical protein